MPTGHFNFRTAYGNVGTRTFRGARYGDALSPIYPKQGLVLDLAQFTYTSVEVTDKSTEGNEAALYSGRGVSLNGTTDFVEIDAFGTSVKSVKILAGAVFDSTLVIKDLTSGDEASVFVDGDSLWHEVELVFANPVAGPFSIGSDQAGGNFGGVLADARFYDAGGSLLDQFYLNQYTDTAGGGLDGLTVIGRNGGVGQCVGCAAVVQEGMLPEVIGLGAYGDAQWFNGVDTKADSVGLGTFFADNAIQRYEFTLHPAPEPTDAIFEFVWSVGTSSTSALHVTRQVASDAIIIELLEGTRNTKLNPVPILQGRYSMTVNRTTGAMSITSPDGSVLNSTESGQTYGKDANGELHIGYRYGIGGRYLTGAVTDFEIYDSTDTLVHSYGLTDFNDGTGSANLTPSGTFATVDQLRVTPPQVLGMNFNEYFRPVESKNGSWQTFDWTFDTGTLHAADSDSDNDFGGLTIPPGAWDVVIVTGSISISSGSPAIRLSHSFTGAGGEASNIEVLSVDGEFSLTFTATGSYQYILFSEADNPSDWTISNLRVYNTRSDQLIPESFTSGIDALGNPIEAKRTSKTFNADGSGYALIPDSDSLDLTTEATWVFKGNFNYDSSTSDEFILDKTSWRVWKNNVPNSERLYMSLAGAAYYIIVPDAKSVICFVYDGSVPSLTAYIDGTPVTPVYAAGALGTSIPVNSDSLTICNGVVLTHPSISPISDVKIYNRALTPEEIAKFK